MWIFEWVFGWFGGGDSATSGVFTKTYQKPPFTSTYLSASDTYTKASK
jgi:hypothetical protein